ncbi:MAG TPA: hypothetical protein VG478_06030 [Acidimicrobiales bacterium]|nr:hypothetical protein [Acidimicrobiales bacterium]
MDGALDPEEIDRLRVRLTRLEQQQVWVANKETLRRVQREAMEIRWRLGLVDDDELAALDDFTEGFDFEG